MRSSCSNAARCTTSGPTTSSSSAATFMPGYGTCSTGTSRPGLYRMRSFRSDPQRSNAAPDKMVRLFQSETAEIIEAPEPFGVRATLYVVAAFFVAIIVVALFTRLDRVVTSTSGRIVTTQPTAVMQALDASLIKTLEVREGQRVSA